MNMTTNSANPRMKYPCTHPGWGKILATSFSYRRHMNLKHSAAKNYAWRYCGKRFSLMQYLKEHILIHTKETPFVWGINGCKLSFRQRAKLCHHRKTHKSSVGKFGGRISQTNFISNELNTSNKKFELSKNLTMTHYNFNCNLQSFWTCDLNDAVKLIKSISQSTETVMLPKPRNF